MDLTTIILIYKGDLFYWYPDLCSEDIRQYEVAKDRDNINFFAMKQTKHGNTLWGESVIMSLIILAEELRTLPVRYRGRIISPYKYCCCTFGDIKAAILLGGKSVKRLFRYRLRTLGWANNEMQVSE